MVDFELVNPVNGFLFGIELLDGVTEDINEGEETELTILSLGLIFFKINYVYLK